MEKHYYPVMNKLKQTAIAAGFLLVAGTAFAQIDDRARELLEGLVPEQEATDVRTMEQHMLMEIVEQGISTATRTIIDFENERALIITDAMGMEVTMRFVDGQMSMVMQGMSLPMPPGMEGTFDGMFEDVTYGGLLDGDVTATYDGVVSYADVLSGHQVSYSGGPVAGVEGELGDDGTVRFIFDDDGQLLGNVVAMGGNSDMVSVYVGEPKLANLPVFDTEMYEVADGTARLFGSMRYEAISINEPLDESLFR